MIKKYRFRAHMWNIDGTGNSQSMTKQSWSNNGPELDKSQHTRQTSILSRCTFTSIVLIFILRVVVMLMLLLFSIYFATNFSVRSVSSELHVVTMEKGYD